MKTSTQPLYEPQSEIEAARQIELFRSSPLQQALLGELLRLTKSITARQCLEIGATGGAFSRHLRKMQGEWHTLLTTPAAVATTRTLVPEKVDHFNPPRLPFEDKTFDLIVLIDPADAITDFATLIEECHRVLQTAGHIVLNLPYAARWSPLRNLRKTLERRTPANHPPRREYGEEDLFDLLKSGFDVIETRSYARFFTELTNLFLQTALRAVPAEAADGFERRLRLHRIAHPFFRVSFQLDYLLYPLRGHRWAALARRHAWRPRNSPVLKDAGCITGAVLSTVKH